MILVTGGTGFIGSKVVHALRTAGRDVRCLVRRPAKATRLEAWGCELATGDVTDTASLQVAAAGCDAVIHLVSIIAGKPADFERVMVAGTHNVLAAAKDGSIRRFVLMSALGTSDETKDLVPYYRAKWEMEQATKASGIGHVIFRPSFVFGRDGGVLPLFIRQVRWSPVIPVVGDGERRLQPIWVEDVAAYFAKAVDLAGAENRTVELAGPDQVTWNQLYERIARTLGKRRPQLHIPLRLMRVGATAAELLPRPPITRDQLTMLEAGDNVCDIGQAVEIFGIDPLPLDEQLRRAARGN
jgi:NADH dehydrogenase